MIYLKKSWQIYENIGFPGGGTKKEIKWTAFFKMERIINRNPYESMFDYTWHPPIATLPSYIGGYRDYISEKFVQGLKK